MPTARFVLTVIALTTIVCMPLADKISPTAFEDGKRIAKKLSFDEIRQINEFASILRELRKLGAFIKIAEAYCKKLAPRGSFIFTSRSYAVDIDISDWMSGVLTGLGISTRDPS